MSVSKLPESENPKVFTPGETSDASIAYVSNEINMKERKNNRKKHTNGRLEKSNWWKNKI